MSAAVVFKRHVEIILFAWKRNLTATQFVLWQLFHLDVCSCCWKSKGDFNFIRKESNITFLVGGSALFPFSVVVEDRNFPKLFNDVFRTSLIWWTRHFLLFSAWGDAVSQLKADVFIKHLAYFVLDGCCGRIFTLPAPPFHPGDLVFSTRSSWW